MAGVVRLQADAVIGGVDVATRDAHVAAIGDVQAVVVPICTVHDRQVVHHHVATQLHRHVPAGTVAQGHVRQRHAVGMRQAEQFGSRRLVGSMAPVVVFWVDAHTLVVQAVDVQRQLQATPVYRALPCDANVVRPVGHHQRQGRIVVCVGRGRFARQMLRPIIIGVGTAQQNRPPLQMECHARLQLNASRHVLARGETHDAATFGRHMIDQSLYLLRLYMLHACLHAEVGHAEHLPLICRSRQCHDTRHKHQANRRPPTFPLIPFHTQNLKN